MGKRIKTTTVTRARRKSIPAVKTVASTVPATAAERRLATRAPASKSKIADAARQYQMDFGQRVILFLDILRERANNMLAYEQAGMPPVLNFEHDTILDARTFERPVNYALLRITGSGKDHIADCVDEDARPVFILDPRAGHGPGIGGFKHDSEVGMAMHEGHPVYFAIFFPEPCPGQTLADVHHTLRCFVEEISRRHQGQAPVLYGNCQGGWAVALLSADCEGLAGPAVLNGSPLSYWAGASDVNPMRLAGGFVGGSWLAHFVSDLGNGRFDGAWLVQNFEKLNPAHALWQKNYDVFAHVDDERKRFLDFERWWNGYYFLSKEEIVAIVENLFIGNQLEQGKLRICENCVVDLTHIRNPLVIFASSGDNITPPHQALNWIPAVYPTTQALKRAKQRIVYLLNPHVGHLGIFVSASVARLEHRAILESLDALEQLKPGLYEMKIDNPTGDPDCRKPQYSVRFEERGVEDIRFDYPREEFEHVRELSAFNESLYTTFVGPWVRATANPLSATLLKWLHPMRVSNYVWSEKLNPWMYGVAALAAAAQAARQPVDDTNPFIGLERQVSTGIAQALEHYRKLRDSSQETAFRIAYR